MSQPADVVTVYRSMDASAKTDCESIIELLAARGIAGAMVDDSAPGVPEGTFEVRVGARDAARAEKLMAESPLPDEVEKVDDSKNLDLVTIGNMAELEAMEVKGLLESNGIAAVLIGDSVLPNFPFEVKVARTNADRALELIAEVERADEADQSGK
ncbi:MAG TPA: DUF2007 domain-containing protein [Bryobacteraceae bacterium]|nr:DUF2007 domain-containing protein [Bryobacteraceae bacterium]